jgi:hypothetical protein
MSLGVATGAMYALLTLLAPLPPRPPPPTHTQATDVLRGSGSLSAERKQYLEDLGNQLGLAAEERDKIIREVRATCPL